MSRPTTETDLRFRSAEMVPVSKLDVALEDPLLDTVVRLDLAIKDMKSYRKNNRLTDRENRILKAFTAERGETIVDILIMDQLGQLRGDVSLNIYTHPLEGDFTDFSRNDTSMLIQTTNTSGGFQEMRIRADLSSIRKAGVVESMADLQPYIAGFPRFDHETDAEFAERTIIEFNRIKDSLNSSYKDPNLATLELRLFSERIIPLASQGEASPIRIGAAHILDAYSLRDKVVIALVDQPRKNSELPLPIKYRGVPQHLLRNYEDFLRNNPPAFHLHRDKRKQ